ncbi:DinB family protein [Saccharibacillus deserti]|uniref:DinB family protein n=1 Tax=Saccharibacillus deserti TaxID=1634444 RepID=UPI0031B5A9F5
MQNVTNLIENLDHLIRSVPAELSLLTEEEFNRKASPSKWSKKEILGHLCDSAANNHYRFMKIMTDDQPVRIESYNQDLWVSLHGYQADYSHTELIRLWGGLNKQIACVWKNAEEKKFDQEVILPDGTSVTLEWLAGDYLDHTRHHLDQILI